MTRIRDLETRVDWLESRLQAAGAEIAALRAAVFEGKHAASSLAAESGSCDSLPPRPFLGLDQTEGGQ